MGLFGLELKRVLKGRLTWGLLALALVLSVVLAYLPTTYCASSYTDEQGNQINVTGWASIAYEKERQSEAAGLATPDRVRGAVEAYQEVLRRYGVTESYDLPQGIYEAEILPIAPLLHGVKEAFADPNTGMAPSLMEIRPEQINGYFSVCQARISSLMQQEMPDCPAAQEKAAEMYRQVEKPFAVYPGFSSNGMDYQNMLSFLVLLFCTVIAAPIFSAAYQSGADDILRCTKYGRGRLGVVKLLAMLCISAVAFGLCTLVYILVSNSLFGWETTKTSIQMLYSIVTLVEMDLGQLQGAFALGGLLSLLAAVSFTLFLSAKCRSVVTALAVALVFCIAPVVVYMILPGEVATWICTLLPASGVGLQTSLLYALTDFQFLHLGSWALWTPYAMVGAYCIEIPLFLCLALRAYTKHRIG